MTMRTLLWLVCALLLASPSWASEARCDALGANCVCSEPFNTSSFTRSDGYLNPGDSTTKQCSYEIANHPAWSYSDLTLGTDATALARLPAGHSVTNILRRNTGHAGIWWVGAGKTVKDLGATYNKRMVTRAYVYHSPDYNFRYDIPGCHSKLFNGEANNLWHWENAQGWIHQYEFANAGWSSPPKDAALYGDPPGMAYRMGEADWQGHWYRAEAVTMNRAGGASPNGLRWILYMTDVSQGVTKVNGGNTFVAADWAGTTSGWGPNWNSIVPPWRQVSLELNLYREVPAGGQCLGFRATSHYMVAGWDTEAGQMIGAATEVEGSGTPTTGTITLSVRSFLPLLFGIVGGAIGVVCMVMGGLRWLERRREYALRTARPSDGPGDFGEQPVEPRPVDGTPAHGGHGVQPMVSVSPADELAESSVEVEGRR